MIIMFYLDWEMTTQTNNVNSLLEDEIDGEARANFE